MIAPFGRHLGIELLKAMQAPVDNCMSVTMEMPRDGVVKVVLTYALDPNWLKEAGVALSDMDQDELGP